MDDRFDTWSQQLQASDREAYTDLFDAMHAPLLRYATRLTHEEEAYDIVQEAFASLWRIRASIDPDRSLKSLLYTLVRNEALNQRRAMDRRRGRHAEYSPNREPSPSAQVEADALRSQLKRWIDDLPERQREAFRLSRFNGLSHDEIADVMDIAPRTVTNHVARALQTLRDRLDHHRSATN